MSAETKTQKIDPRYILAKDIDPQFKEGFITAPSHLQFPTRNHYAFLKGVMGTDPAKEKIVSRHREVYVITDSGYVDRDRSLRERELTPDEVKEFKNAAKNITGGVAIPESLDHALSLLKHHNDPIISLNLQVGEDKVDPLENFLIPESGHAQKQDFVGLSEMIEGVFEQMPERQVAVLRRRFGIGYSHHMTLEEVGQELGVTRERIRQIEVKGLGTFKRLSRGLDLEDYLRS